MNIDKAFGIEQKTVEVNGVEYTLQNMPFKKFYEMQERNRDENGNPLPSGMYQEIFDNVIIKPKVSWDHFESTEEIEQLMVEVFRFLKRREPKTNESTAQTERAKQMADVATDHGGEN